MSLKVNLRPCDLMTDRAFEEARLKAGARLRGCRRVSDRSVPAAVRGNPRELFEREFGRTEPSDGCDQIARLWIS